jgi:hypothetical protein
VLDWTGLGFVLAIGVLGVAVSRVLLQRWLDHRTFVSDDKEGFWGR